jgi:hypothetical protein
MTGPLFFRQPGIWFIRMGSYVLHAKDVHRHRLFFSERNGYGPRAVTLFNWRITVKKP